MNDLGRLLWLALGLTLGVGGTGMFFASSRPAEAANDRFEDYILSTGPVSIKPRDQTDGVWLLDYRAGKLLGTVIDRVLGKIVSWAEVDLVTEFGIQPKLNVHFLMTTGTITHGQAAVYVAETTTGQIGVYTMGPRPDGLPGIAIRRHDMTAFRQPSAK
jgi:hypothetical protein